MNSSAIRIADLAQHMLGDQPLDARGGYRFDSCRIEVRGNTPEVIQRLDTYFADFRDPAAVGAADITVTAVEAATAELDLDFAVKPPDPGKTKIKEEYIDAADGRIVRKRLTGMIFLFGGEQHLAYGPCLENDNQLINFINNRFIQWTLDRGWLLCHAAAVARGRDGLALAGFSGMGKSTLALELMRRELTFISNDRLMIQRGADGLRMLGVAKLPRVNPGTVLNNPALAPVMAPAERERVAGLAPDALWALEQKYDVWLDRCFGPGRFRLDANMRGLLMLNWQLDGGPLRIRPVSLAERADLLGAFSKSVGLFYDPEQGAAPPDFSPQVYLEVMADCPVFELSGGVDFARAADAGLALLETGSMPEG